MAWIQGPTSQLKFKCKLVIQHPEAATSAKSQSRCNEGPAHARGRPVGLALDALKLRNEHQLQEKITDVQKKVGVKW